jgi:hypothetical protein
MKTNFCKIHLLGLLFFLTFSLTPKNAPSQSLSKVPETIFSLVKGNEKKDIEAYRRIYIETKDGSEIKGRVVTLNDNYLVLEKDSVLISDIELIGIYQYGTQAVGGGLMTFGALFGALSAAFLYAAYLSDFNGSNGLIEMVLTAIFGTASIASWHVGYNVFYYKKKYRVSDGWSLKSN